jgi:hypothetical protein
MSKSRNRRKPVTTEPSVFDLARDEMFQHIIQCGVIGADPEHQAEWFADTIVHMGQRWHELTPKELADLRTLGERFARPARGAAAAPAAQPAVPATTSADAVDAEPAADVDTETADAEELDAVSA